MILWLLVAVCLAVSLFIVYDLVMSKRIHVTLDIALVKTLFLYFVQFWFFPLLPISEPLLMIFIWSAYGVYVGNTFAKGRFNLLNTLICNIVYFLLIRAYCFGSGFILSGVVKNTFSSMKDVDVVCFFFIFMSLVAQFIIVTLFKLTDFIWYLFKKLAKMLIRRE